MGKVYLFIYTCCLANVAMAQYSPQAGLPGSIAISAASSLFTGWASHCVVHRGLMDIANPSLGYASDGDSSQAIGAADGFTVSLGDSGVADLTFKFPIYNGDGADFAVFENGFPNPANDSQAFLELGFVEVSSDGVNYFRFPATSLTQDNTQISNADYMDAANLNNLAGNFIAKYGTPFDLQELSGIAALDINNITHVRVVDVVGSISGHSSHDSAGRTINDPYPTPFASCGFDLDAVGVIHQTGNAAVSTITQNNNVNIYPDPATDMLVIAVKDIAAGSPKATITDMAGRILLQSTLSQNTNELCVSRLPAGIYCILLQDQNGNKWAERFVKR